MIQNLSISLVLSVSLCHFSDDSNLALSLPLSLSSLPSLLFRLSSMKVLRVEPGGQVHAEDARAAPGVPQEEQGLPQVEW